MIGPAYWFVAVLVRFSEHPTRGLQVIGSLEFLDDGFAEPHCTEGTLRMRYRCDAADFEDELRVLVDDAKRLGMVPTDQDGGPFLMVESDGFAASTYYTPPNWKELIAGWCAAIGYRNIYQGRGE